MKDMLSNPISEGDFILMGSLDSSEVTIFQIREILLGEEKVLLQQFDPDGVSTIGLQVTYSITISNRAPYWASIYSMRPFVKINFPEQPTSSDIYLYKD